MSVPESTAPGSELLQVHATDADDGENAVLVYVLLPTTGLTAGSSDGTRGFYRTQSNKFRIDPYLGTY